MVRKPNQILSNASATGESTVIHDVDYKLAGMRRNTVVVEIRAHASTPTFSIQPKQSIDGTVWYNLGSTIAAVGMNVLTCECSYFKLTIATI